MLIIVRNFDSGQMSIAHQDDEPTDAETFGIDWLPESIPFFTGALVYNGPIAPLSEIERYLNRGGKSILEK